MRDTHLEEYLQIEEYLQMGSCNLCDHSLENNSHGLDPNDLYVDQNDLYVDENEMLQHFGSCTYCRVCNPRLFSRNS
jgi:hypothetical protein